MKKSRFTGEIALALAAVIWGSAFVAQSLGSYELESFTYNAARFTIGALTILPAILLTEGKRLKNMPRSEIKTLFWGGLCCGLTLTLACYLQQSAIACVDADGNKSNVGKVGFLTALYIVMVPVLSIFFGKKTNIRTWISVLLALLGMVLITDLSNVSLSKSDLLSIICSLVFALQILCVDVFAPKLNGLMLSASQFLFAGVFSLICSFLFETPTIHALWAGKWSLLYVGILSCGIAYTLQIVGQKYCSRPQVASLIMSLESVFSLLFGFLILGQTMKAKELIGCAVMLCAVVLTQLEPRKKAD